jgi:hypothetical protein
VFTDPLPSNALAIHVTILLLLLVVVVVVAAAAAAVDVEAVLSAPSLLLSSTSANEFC